MESFSKRRAVFEERLERPLNELTAVEFLEMLTVDHEMARNLRFWPEKKKYELWVEPENFGVVPCRDIFDIMRQEKKKVELEKFPGGENVINPGDLLSQVDLDRIVDAIEVRLKQRR